MSRGSADHDTLSHLNLTSSDMNAAILLCRAPAARIHRLLQRLIAFSGLSPKAAPVPPTKTNFGNTLFGDLHPRDSKLTFCKSYFPATKLTSISLSRMDGRADRR